MPLAHNAPLSEKLIYMDHTVDVEAVIAALARLEALDLVLENYALDTDPEGLDIELKELFPDE